MNPGRLRALVAKERKQMLRDFSNIGVGIVMPLLLLTIFGYGMSLDVKNIRLAIVQPAVTELSSDVIARFANSGYFTTTAVRDTAAGVESVRRHESDAVLILPHDLDRRVRAGDASAFIGLNASNAAIARMYEGVVRSVLASAIAAHAPPGEPGVVPKVRVRYNEANESAYFLIPGVIVIIMALIGCLLTALQMAKEYEHGNMESLFVTPMTSGEILLAKMANNYLLGMVGLALTLLCARYLFDVPLRGSLALLLIGSSLFLILQMALGLLISSVTKSQFIASQIAMVVSFMPVFLLSGFLYEIPNMPPFLQAVSYALPARYFVDFLQSIFLVGTVPGNVVRNFLAMGAFTVLYLALAKLKNPKRVA